VRQDALGGCSPASRRIRLRLAQPEFQLGRDIHGDVNCFVESHDCEIWQSSFGSTTFLVADGNGNGNGIVDAADYTVWRDHLGATLAAGAAANALADPLSGYPAVAPLPELPTLAIAAPSLLRVIGATFWRTTRKRLSPPR
jgi:hypothetical protein